MAYGRWLCVGTLAALCALSACKRRQTGAVAVAPPAATALSQVDASGPARPLPQQPVSPKSPIAVIGDRPSSLAALIARIDPRPGDGAWLLPVVSDALNHPDFAVRAAGIGLADRMGPDAAPVAPRLRELADDQDPAMRAAATAALADVGVDAGSALPGIVLSVQSPIGSVALASLQYLRLHPIDWSARDLRRRAAASIVRVLLHTSQQDLRAAAIATLPAYDTDGSDAALAALSTTAIAQERERLFDALDAFGPAAARAAPRELLMIVSDRNAPDRARAVATVARFAPRDFSTWAKLLKIAGEPEPIRAPRSSDTARRAALKALHDHLADAAFYPQLAEALRNEEMAPAALDLLRESGTAGAAAVPVIVRMLPGAPPALQARLASVVASIGPEARSAIGDLGALLGSPDESVRALAAEAIASIGREAAVTGEALTRLLADPSPRVRTAAAYALARTAPTDQDLGADLVEAVKRKDTAICAVLAVNLKLNSESGRRARLKLTDLARHDPDETTRTLAWTALHDMGDPLGWRYSDRRAEGE